MHPALVEPLHHARSSSKMCANFHSLTYTALQYAGHFAGPSRSMCFLHHLKVYILELLPKCAQTSIHGPILHCSTRSFLRSSRGRWVFCTNSRFAVIGFCSPLLHFHTHPALMQPLYRARSSSKMYANFHSRIYTALPFAQHFAGPSRSVGFPHQFKVYIFRLSFPIDLFSYAPCFGATIVPC